MHIWILFASESVHYECIRATLSVNICHACVPITYNVIYVRKSINPHYLCIAFSSWKHVLQTSVCDVVSSPSMGYMILKLMVIAHLNSYWRTYNDMHLICSVSSEWNPTKNHIDVMLIECAYRRSSQKDCCFLSLIPCLMCVVVVMHSNIYAWNLAAASYSVQRTLTMHICIYPRS